MSWHVHAFGVKVRLFSLSLSFHLYSRQERASANVRRDPATMVVIYESFQAKRNKQEGPSQHRKRRIFPEIYSRATTLDKLREKFAGDLFEAKSRNIDFSSGEFPLWDTSAKTGGLEPFLSQYQKKNKGCNGLARRKRKGVNHKTVFVLVRKDERRLGRRRLYHWMGSTTSSFHKASIQVYFWPWKKHYRSPFSCFVIIIKGDHKIQVKSTKWAVHEWFSVITGLTPRQVMRSEIFRFTS